MGFQEKFGKVSNRNFLLAYLGNVYINYCSSRTLINTLEMALTNIALLLYSRATSQNEHGFMSNSTGYVAVIAASFCMRMTTALLWLPLVLHHVQQLMSRGQFWSVLVAKMVPTAVGVLAAASAIDTAFYRSLNLIEATSVLFVPWNFFQLNVLQDISPQYGHEPWHYYLTAS